MDIRQLKHLVALVELGTVHAAAEQQSISQPGLSSSIKRLEEQLGADLFEREGRGMKPNKKGLEFYKHAKFMLEQLRLARAEIDVGQASLVIGVGEARPADLTTVLTDGLLKEYPNLTLKFVQGHYDTLFALVEKGEVDVAFVGAPIETLPVSLVGNVLSQSLFGVYCASNHPLAHHKEGGAIPLEELANYRWVDNSASPANAMAVPRFERSENLPLKDLKMITAGSQDMAIQMVVNSYALGYGPQMAFAVELELGRVVRLDLPIRKIHLYFTDVKRRGVYSSVLDKAFEITEKFFAESYSEEDKPSTPAQKKAKRSKKSVATSS